MFWSRPYEALILSQRAEISDLRAELRSERELYARETQRLLDRIIALTQPAAHREIHRPPLTAADIHRENARRALPKRLHFPGSGRQSFPAPTPPAALEELLEEPEAAP